jgi:hypothetical protein
MPFLVGTAGAAGAQLLFGTLSHPLGTVAYNADGISLEVNDAAGSRIAGGPVTAGASVGPSGFLNALNVSIVVADALVAWADATVDGSADDTGILASALGVANAQSLPANFGPGRGNWVAADLGRLHVTQAITYGTYATPADFTTNPLPLDIAIAGGDVTMVFKNTALEEIDSFVINLLYLHSQML